MRTHITNDSINKVSQVLSKLQKEYPEVYKLLDEEPTAITYNTNVQMDDNLLLTYVQSIEALLKGLAIKNKSNTTE